ncbi:hypothetical protein SAMN05518672_11578 [Chitinophaga sp. CF118]|uniref:hypothetical protein n=1 Tax=Chitinophaga sp. CF118 TaxID=1884367 RepID=UPI0008F2825F|nr:hypothetical protein [Chitinophaga sp. CF118]SFF07460.1 hypothetical protein SAMN05518672_11578 [Chitinophaga sp. CF118]
MIDIIAFKQFLKENFDTSILSVDEFKPDLQFVDIDCLKDIKRKLTLEISNQTIKVSTVSKEAELDFSLYDYCFESVLEAQIFLSDIKKTGVFKTI